MLVYIDDRQDEEFDDDYENEEGYEYNSPFEEESYDYNETEGNDFN